MVSRQLAGVLLVALGVAQLVSVRTSSGGELVVALGGAAFLAAFLATRAYGFLVPGGILTGVGIALLLPDRGLPVAVLQLGLAGGFLAIPLLQLITRAPRERGWWWPLLPAGILGALGGVALVDDDLFTYGFPGLLVVAGIVAVASGARGAGKRAGRRQAARDAERAEREAAAALPAPTEGAGDAALGAEPQSEDGGAADRAPDAPAEVDPTGPDAPR